MTLRRCAALTAASMVLLTIAFGAAVTSEASDSATATEAIPIGSVAPAAQPVIETPPVPMPTPEFVQAPATIVTPVSPPVLVEIPAELINPQAVGSDTADNPLVSLPMLTNIPAGYRDGGVVYLTFDDGPSPAATGQILDLLAAYNAKATFFVLGSASERHPDLVRRIAAEGHAIGNHTWAHEALPLETPERIEQTLASTSATITRLTGRPANCVRPPYGALDRATYDLIIAKGYSVSMWEVDSNDWQLGNARAIAAEVLANTGLGDRVLLHDGPSGRSSTVAAVATVLDILSSRGVTFAALPC